MPEFSTNEDVDIRFGKHFQRLDEAVFQAGAENGARCELDHLHAVLPDYRAVNADAAEFVDENADLAALQAGQHML